jgi:hypothetical protein
VNAEAKSATAASANAILATLRRSRLCIRKDMAMATRAPPKKLSDADHPAKDSLTADSSTSTPTIAGSTSSGSSAMVPIAENTQNRLKCRMYMA